MLIKKVETMGQMLEFPNQITNFSSNVVKKGVSLLFGKEPQEWELRKYFSNSKRLYLVAGKEPFSLAKVFCISPKSDSASGIYSWTSKEMCSPTTC